MLNRHTISSKKALHIFLFSSALSRDILRWAPLEVSYLIFSYLDGSSLLSASLVSKTWNRRVFGEKRLWETLRKRLGVDYGEQENTEVGERGSRNVCMDQFGGVLRAVVVYLWFISPSSWGVPLSLAFCLQRKKIHPDCTH